MPPELAGAGHFDAGGVPSAGGQREREPGLLLGVEVEGGEAPVHLAVRDRQAAAQVALARRPLVGDRVAFFPARNSVDGTQMEAVVESRDARYVGRPRGAMIFPAGERLASIVPGDAGGVDVRTDPCDRRELRLHVIRHGDDRVDAARAGERLFDLVRDAGRDLRHNQVGPIHVACVAETAVEAVLHRPVRRLVQLRKGGHLALPDVADHAAQRRADHLGIVIPTKVAAVDAGVDIAVRVVEDESVDAQPDPELEEVPELVVPLFARHVDGRLVRPDRHVRGVGVRVLDPAPGLLRTAVLLIAAADRAPRVVVRRSGDGARFERPPLEPAGRAVCGRFRDVAARRLHVLLRHFEMRRARPDVRGVEPRKKLHVFVVQVFGEGLEVVGRADGRMDAHVIADREAAPEHPRLVALGRAVVVRRVERERADTAGLERVREVLEALEV
mmetsp:Transcript_32825/g.101705  ORF Transcript_32825/g.101705 Transcript_32825/m.101705 type:complete len:444 (+) Transcript_32825:729-2060(+)